MSKIMLHSIVAALVGLLLSACAVVEFGGKMAKKAGDTLTGYSKENDGAVGQAAGVAGGVYTTAGNVAEDSAKSGKGEKTTQSAADTKHATASGSSTGTKSSTQDNVIAKAQVRLKELGYDGGAPIGVMTSKTTEAIGQFQASRALKVTKALDKPTLAALGISGTK
ncbi:MAG: peptidoglycan-binding protein [Rhodocyclales bacterium]|nr:peptidoglycan-binding protein [Rhodocyclales bacterium]